MWTNFESDSPPSATPTLDNNAQQQGTLSDTLTTLQSTQTLSLYTCTFNQAGSAPPQDLSPFFSQRRLHHIYAFGSQEAGDGIVASLLAPSAAAEKFAAWESLLAQSLGGSYVKLASHALGAMHLVIFVVRTLLPVVSDVQSSSAPTGWRNTLGTKGGVGIGFNVGKTAMLFVNSHLAAHQRALGKRNADWARIDSQLKLTPSGYLTSSRIAHLAMTEASDVAALSSTGTPSAVPAASASAMATDDASAALEQSALAQGAVHAHSAVSVQGSAANAPLVEYMNWVSRVGVTEEDDEEVLDVVASSDLRIDELASQRYDRVFWMGDLNYRIGLGGKPRVEGAAAAESTGDALPSWTRAQVDALVSAGDVSALMSADQLIAERTAGRVARGFSEGPLLFAPTYKFDVGADSYDSGAKSRIPAWTDRVLFRSVEGAGDGISGEGGIRICSYRSVSDVKTSDHRPVVAEFDVKLRGSHLRRESSRSSSVLSSSSLSSSLSASAVVGATVSGAHRRDSAALPPLPIARERARTMSLDARSSSGPTLSDADAESKLVAAAEKNNSNKAFTDKAALSLADLAAPGENTATTIAPSPAAASSTPAIPNEKPPVPSRVSIKLKSHARCCFCVPNIRGSARVSPA